MSKYDNENSNKVSRFMQFLKYGSISTLSFIAPLLAFLIVAIYVVVKLNFLPALPKILNDLILLIAALLMGSVGLIYIYRKEMPGLTSSTTIKGKLAVISGLLLIVFFWGLGLFMLFVS